MLAGDEGGFIGSFAPTRIISIAKKWRTGMNEPARIRIPSVDGGYPKLLPPWVVCLYVLAVLAFLAAPSQNLYAVTPDRNISQYGHRSWKIEDGYLGAAPRSIAQ